MERALLFLTSVRIEIVSTLTADDERQLAQAVLRALSGVLSILPIAYVIQAETQDGLKLQHASSTSPIWHGPASEEGPKSPSELSSEA